MPRVPRIDGLRRQEDQSFSCHNTICAQVFFIRDGFKFPDLVHALRPNPANNIQEAWRFLDFLSYHPESAHMVNNSTDASSVLDAPHL